MSRINKRLSLILLLIIASGCHRVPVSNDYTARSLGKGKWDGAVGFSGTFDLQPYARIGYGASDNVDVGMVVEAHSDGFDLGVFGKYAFLQKEEKWSVAGIGGVGYYYDHGDQHEDFQPANTGHANGSYVYAGPMVSYKYKWWEPFAVLRVNCLPQEMNSSYLQATIGNTIWFTKKFALVASLNGMTNKGGSRVVDNVFVVGSIGLAYRF